MIGSDVSRARLDVHGLADGRRLAVGDDPAGIAALAERLALGARDRLVMEASGGYGRLAHRLPSAGAASRSPWSTRPGCGTSPGPAAGWPRPTASTPG